MPVRSDMWYDIGSLSDTFVKTDIGDNVYKLALFMAVIIISTGIYAFGYFTGSGSHYHTNPVCHSITEDSNIYDCDYRNGTWYQK